MQTVVYSDLLAMDKATVEKTEEANKAIPRPRGTLFFGNLFQVDPSRFHRDLYDLMKKHGDIFTLSFFGEDIVFLNSVDLCREAFAKKDLQGRTDNFYAEYMLYSKKCISNAQWMETTKALRKMELSLMQSHSEMINALEPIFQAELKRFQTSLKDNAGKVTNLTELVKFSVGNTLSIALNGRQPTPEKTQKIVDYNIRDMYRDGLIFKLTKFPVLRYLPGRAGSVYKELLRARTDMVETFLACEKASQTGDVGNGYIQKMLEFIQEERDKNTDNVHLTEDHIRGLVADFRAGSFGPILENLCMMFLLLMKHPDILKQTQQEIDSVLGDNDPALEHRPRMHLTQAVILETLRYGSMVPLSIAHVATSDVIVGGYVIKHDTQVFGNLYGMHHDDQIWGDPFVFRPGRFLDDDGTLVPADHRLRLSLLPFSAGVRTCTGRDFVLSRLFLYVTSVLQKFDLCQSDEKPLPEPEPRDWKFCAVIETPVIMCSIAIRDQKE